MDPSLALFLSIALILLLIALRVNVSFAIFAGSFLLGILTIEFRTFDRLFYVATSFQTLRLLVIVLSAFTLGYSMQELGLLRKLCDSVSNSIGKLSLLILPAIVGFLPMPGGALVSAVMLTDLIRKYELKAEKATFVNYWFRHLWVPIWPLYPSFVIAMAVVEVEFWKILESCYPVTLGMILAGVLLAKDLIESSKFERIGLKDLISSLYPLIIVAVTAIVLKVDLAITLPIAVAILYIHKRPKFSDLKRIFRRTIDPKIILLIFAVMFYKDLIACTNSAKIFFYHLREFGIPIPLASFVLSFVVGFAVGIEISYSAIALPLLTAFTGVGYHLIPKNLMLVFGAGLLGVMMSPLHLCLILTSEYYSAEMAKVYRFLVPAGLILLTVVWLFYIL